MNRETKIGLLTGLFVIILVGVLLSEYLGGADRAPKQAALADVGAEYRHRTLNQVGVPVLDRETGHVVNNPILPRENQLLMAAAPTGPMITPPVNPIPAAGMDAERTRLRDEQERLAAIAAAQRQQQLALMQTQQIAQVRQAQPVISVEKAPVAPVETVTYVPGTVAAVKPAPELKPKASAENYVIAKGDTLGRISAKFYGTSKSDMIMKIVAANPEVLKDGLKSNLIIGKQLLIPSADTPMPESVKVEPVMAAVPASPKTESGVNSSTGLPKVIPAGAHADAGNSTKTEKKTEAKSDQPKTHKDAIYVVEKGDNLGVIAKKMYGSSKPAFVKLILDANKGVKPENLKIGQELKIPEKPN